MLNIAIFDQLRLWYTEQVIVGITTGHSNNDLYLAQILDMALVQWPVVIVQITSKFVNFQSRSYHKHRTGHCNDDQWSFQRWPALRSNNSRPWHYYND